VQSAAKGEVVEADRAYVATIVASRANIPPEEARARVDQRLSIARQPQARGISHSRKEWFRLPWNETSTLQ